MTTLKAVFHGAFLSALTGATLAAATVARAEGQSQATLPRPPQPADAGVPAAQTASTRLELRTGMLGRSMEDTYVNSKYAGATIDLSGERVFTPAFSARLEMSVIMATGTVSNQYSAEGGAPNAFSMNEASLTFKPWTPLTLQAGVLPMQFSSVPSTLEAVSVPSVRQTFALEGRHAKANVFAMQAIPAAGTPAVKMTENGVNSALYVYGGGLSSNPQDRQRLTVSGSVMRFAFENLNTSAATDSQYLGNSVVAQGPQARFAYGFGGHEVSGALAYKMGDKARLTLNGGFLRNERAPSDRNRGYLYTAGVSMPVFGREVGVGGGYFYNESDTLPGSYSSGGRGSNNRFGNIARLTVRDEKQKASGFLSFTRANEITDRPYTADRDTLVFGLEAAYDVL